MMGLLVDYQLLFNIAVGIAGFFGGWTLNSISKAIERLDTDVRAMPHTYVSREDWKDAMKEVREEMRSGFDKLDLSLATIFNKLDGKEDKAR